MNRKVLSISAAIPSVFSFSYVPRYAWAGRVNEKKYKNETEVRGILAIQVSSPLVWKLKMRPTMGRSRPQSCCYLAHLGHISSSELLLFGPPWAHLVLRVLLLFGPPWAHLVLRVYCCYLTHLGHISSSKLLLFGPPWAHLVLRGRFCTVLRKAWTVP